MGTNQFGGKGMVTPKMKTLRKPKNHREKKGIDIEANNDL